uniref:Uncharacterized protein n=1 Tax=Zea mays TaxID=4577 RepID=B7ZXW2_MAIZE|nr:unknown [Zea mays]
MGHVHLIRTQYEYPISRCVFASAILSFNKWYSRVYSLCIFIVFRAKELLQEKFFIRYPF